MPGTQLRRYEIKPGTMDEFVEAWRGILPIRETFGFRVECAVVDADHDEFVWVVSHDGDFAAADAAYHESPARAGVERNPADYVDVMHLAMVEPA